MSLLLNKNQNDLLYLLRLEGLRRQIELHEAQEERKKADEIEKKVNQYVVDNNEYYIARLEHDIRGTKNGDRVTDEFDICLIDENIFMNDYLPKVQKAYKDLYNIDNPFNFVYSHPFHQKEIKAEKEFYKIAVEFLKIVGRMQEAEAMLKAINGYLNPDSKNRLKELTENFISGEVV